MKLNYLSETFFPFLVPEKDSSFASSVGPHTVYPAGFSLGRALQIYWNAQNYRLVAAGNGTQGSLSQALAVNALLPPRNMGVGTNTYFEVDGFTPVGPGDLVPGYGLRAVMTGTGTVTEGGSDGGTNPAAIFNLQVDLFFPEIFVADPVIKYAGLWWPAMSVSCAVSNPVPLSSGGSLSMIYQCATYDTASTTEIGTMSFFGVTLPMFCRPLHPASGSTPAETRSFSGTLTVANDWP